MKSFMQWFLTEEKNDTIVCAFGRFNPPSIGHLKLMEAMKELGKKNNADVNVYASHSQDPKKNPLDYNTKIKFMKKLAPKGVNIVNSSIKNPFEMVISLAEDDYKNIIVVAGDDRIKEYQKAEKYAIEAGAESLKVISAGKRDPDAEGVEGMSASKLRKAVVDGDEELFKSGTGLKDKDASALFKEVKKGMGL